MTSFNQVILIGNLGRDPEVLKESKSGTFVRLTVVTNRTYTEKDGSVNKKAQYHTVYLNNGLGKYAATYYKKGQKVLVRGELDRHDYKDKEGKKCYETAVWASECSPLSRSKSHEEEAGPEENHSAEAVTE